MSIWQGLILGLVQGLTEFLPVSSSGHLVLVEALTGVHFTDVTVEVSLHVATLASVLVLYGRRLWEIVRGVLKGDGPSVRYAVLLVIATIPAGLIGVLFHHQIEDAFHSLTWLGIQFLITGAILWSTRSPSDGNQSVPSAGAATAIGFAQAFAILKGLAGIDFVGMDIVEVAPPYDVADITALAAAHIAHEWLALYAVRPGGPAA